VWRREAKGKGLAVPGDGKNAEGWSSEDKFAVVLETAPLLRPALFEKWHPALFKVKRRSLSRALLESQRLCLQKSGLPDEIEQMSA